MVGSNDATAPPEGGAGAGLHWLSWFQRCKKYHKEGHTQCSLYSDSLVSTFEATVRVGSKALIFKPSFVNDGKHYGYLCTYA